MHVDTKSPNLGALIVVCAQRSLSVMMTNYDDDMYLVIYATDLT